MKSCFSRFNIYLLAVAVGLGGGCRTDKQAKEEKQKEKEATLMRFHLEVNPDGTAGNGPITVLRTSPVTINVNRTPFLTEADIEKAMAVEQMGIPMIHLQFRFPDGVRLLEWATTQYKGQRIAIFSQFPEARWLAAPLITQRIFDGAFTFTPDASKEEVERIVRGLNNVARTLKKHP